MRRLNYYLTPVPSPLSPPPMDSLEGHLLLASDHMLDPNFAKSVVLLIEHNEQGRWA